jgi:predicted secreted protein
MRIKIKQTVLIIMAIIGFSNFLVVLPVGAVNQCGGVDTAIIDCDQPGSEKDVKKTGLWGLLLLGINILTAGVGIAAVVGIVWGSALFLTAAGNPTQFAKGRMVIWNTVIGILVYAAMYAFLNYLIPGGLFS